MAKAKGSRVDALKVEVETLTDMVEDLIEEIKEDKAGVEVEAPVVEVEAPVVEVEAPVVEVEAPVVITAQEVKEVKVIPTITKEEAPFLKPVVISGAIHSGFTV